MTFEKQLDGLNGIITGGFHGIGKAIAEECAKHGSNLILVGKSEKEGNKKFVEHLESFGGKITALYVDLVDVNAIDAIVHITNRTFGEVHFLVNNAAIITRNLFLDLSIKEYDDIMNVNLKTPFFLTQKIAEVMKEKQVKGSILNVSSISAFRSSKNISHYECAKSGLHMLTLSASYNLAEYGIRVNEIVPGLTATQGNSDQRKDSPELWQQRAIPIPLGRTGLPEDHAAAAVFLLSNKASWITGASLSIDGGLLTRF